MASLTYKQNATFLDEMTKSVHIWKKSSFLGQIADLNLWNRPLANAKINEFDFNTEEGFEKKSKPEILMWSKASIKELGNNTRIFTMPRPALICHNNNGIKQLRKSQYFKNLPGFSYAESLSFCQFLRGNLLFLNDSKLSYMISEYWVSIVKSCSKNNTKWELDEPILNQSKNTYYEP